MNQHAEHPRIKFELAADQLDRLQNLLARDEQLAEPPHFETRRTVYYDSRDRSLRSAGYSLRVLSGPEPALQLVADPNGAAYRYFETLSWRHSGEMYRSAPSEISSDVLPEELQELTGNRLLPVFTVEAERRKYALIRKDCEIIAVVASGAVKTSGRTASFCESQFWLKGGSASEFFSFVLAIDETIPLRLAARTDACRGYTLLEGRERKEIKRKTITLNTHMTSATAFRLIAHECLHQVVANEPAMSAGNPEALHQVRIGLRRLKTALSLFTPLCADAQTPAIKAEIRWFAELLSPARDLDVFLSEVVLPLREQYRDEPGLLSLQRTYSAQRTKLYDRISQAANSARFRSFAIEIAAWIETGLWAMNQSEQTTIARKRPIEQFAEEELTRLRKKVKKKGDRLVSLDPDERHKLRLHVKKLRYAAEFFASLFPGRRKSKRAFLASLKSLQAALGDVNDIAVCTDLKAEIITEKKSRAGLQKLQHRAFATGLIIGHQRAKIETIVKQAERAYKDFLDAKPFWTSNEPKEPPPPVKNNRTPDLFETQPV